MRIARIFGVPVRIDWSWLLIFGLLAWSLALPGGPFGAIVPAWRAPVAALAALALFACVVIHESAHALTARRFGIGTREIDLFVFGGVSQLEGDPVRPADAAQIAAAGPLTSFALALLFAAAAAVASGAAQQVLAYLAFVNAALALFNLLPAYPMDGGRIFHAMVWRITGRRERATQAAVALSMLAGFAGTAAGLVLIVQGALLDGIWIAVLAWFVIRAAQSEGVADLALTPLAQVPAGSIADAPPPCLEPDITCEGALERMVRTRQRALAVCIGTRFLGLVTLADFAKLGDRRPGEAYVTSIMTPAERVVTIEERTPALEAFKRLAGSGFRQLPVVDAQGTLRGFIGHETVARALAFGMERGPLAVR